VLGLPIDFSITYNEDIRKTICTLTLIEEEGDWLNFDEKLVNNARSIIRKRYKEGFLHVGQHFVPNPAKSQGEKSLI